MEHGQVQAFAALLRSPRWLAGADPPPQEVFLDALDVIADGPYARPERRRPRVAVLHRKP